ncbi:MAG TPA: T9SS type B sorting domain-containing protein, partial [Flavobacteriales bacterium]|nr:T9SS type B sorting domain-containing protein [Flavobacteriales bacterium]
YSTFPTTVTVMPEDVDTLHALPNMYYDFVYWEIKHNMPNLNDTGAIDLPVTFFSPDTVIAHLRPQDHVYYVPNAFTPNGDAINDDWRPIHNVVELETYDLRIFDRWGHEVFASADPYKSWDGTNSGTLVPPGVYGFQAHLVEAITLEKHDVMGHVTVVR